MSHERAAALAFLALSVAYTLLAVRIEDAARSPVPILGPRGFPLMVGAAGIVVSLVLLVNAASAPGTVARPVFSGDWRRVLALCALMLVYAAALPRVGFMLSTAAFLAASFGLLGERRPVALVVVPVVTAVALLAILRGVLGAHLPEPLLEAMVANLR